MKLHIVGASGSGVTTLGVALSKQLNMSYFDTDSYFWKPSHPPFTIKQQPSHRNSIIKNDLEEIENWILGGSVIGWGDDIFPVFDLIIFLWIPSEVRISRLRQREFDRYGNIIFSNPVRRVLFERFINWAKDYDIGAGIANRTFQAHESWLNNKSSPVIKIFGDLTTAERITLVLEAVKLHSRLDTPST